jgi:hemolysin activation/secretion protein
LNVSPEIAKEYKIHDAGKRSWMSLGRTQVKRGVRPGNLFAWSTLICLTSVFGCYVNTIFTSPKDEADRPISSKINSEAEPSESVSDPIVGLVRSIEFSGVSGLGITEEDLRTIQIELTEEAISSGTAYRAAESGQANVTIRLSELESKANGVVLRASALKTILEAISRSYQEHRIAAVRVNVTRGAIEQIRKPKSDGVLTIQVQEGEVAQVRAISVTPKSEKKIPAVPEPESAEGNNKSGKVRLIRTGGGNSDKQDNAAAVESKSDPNEARKDPLEERIRRLSAVQRGGLVKLNELDRYVAHLNRHPGRQVDVALAPGPRDGGLTLDYLITESKQPMFYGQISNTGTEQTSRCREQFGFIHHNLTRADDILYVDYITGNFDSVHGISGGYERPVGDWTRLRAKVFGSWREYEAAEVGIAGQEFKGENYSVGGELMWNFFQQGKFFVDAVGGVQHQRVKTENEMSGTKGKSNFLLPYFGFRAEQRTEKSNLSASLLGEFNVPCLVDTDDEGLMRLDRLGRVNTDRRWLTWRYALSSSFFLEPILDSKWRAPGHRSTLAHELFTSVRGQITMNDRRAPANYTQTVGGFYTVRGYPESFASGDNTVLGTVEYRYHWPRSLKPNPKIGTLFNKDFRWQPEHELGRPDWDLVFRGFFDAGRASKNDKLSFENDLTLISSGLGVELSIRNNMKIRADWGWPLKSADNGEDEVEVGGCRVHLSLSFVF